MVPCSTAWPAAAARLRNRDGIDTGGHTSSLRATIANVESYELRYPILYLYRHQTLDSGGPGKYRGGAGISMLYTVQADAVIATKVLHTFGVEQPESPGLCGGYPSTTNQFEIVRGSDVRERFAAGEVPQTIGDLKGELEVFGAYGVTSMGPGDVYRAVSMGGGGYGDPLDRESGAPSQATSSARSSRASGPSASTGSSCTADSLVVDAKPRRHVATCCVTSGAEAPGQHSSPPRRPGTPSARACASARRSSTTSPAGHPSTAAAAATCSVPPKARTSSSRRSLASRSSGSDRT